MGVQDLWSIIGPVRESVPLYSLTGKTLAVDLSLWVCEAMHVQGMIGIVTKPHLRNLFFRVSSLTLMGVKLVFVMEGEPPKLKAETMTKRTALRFGSFKKATPKTTSTKSTNRGRFNAVLRECAEMLDYLGVPWVTAAGEAEAMCAYLDAQGLVDGCITNDGDAFLYGAQTVYRNFNLNTKDPQVDCYKMSRVQTELNLPRETLVGLAILLGCDYIPKGIPGVGKGQTLKLIQSLKGQTLLQRFNQWQAEGGGVLEPAVKKVTHCNVCRHPGTAKTHERSGCVLCGSKNFCEPQDYDYQCPCNWHRYEQTCQVSSVDAHIRKKTLANEQFPFTEIINEFILNKDKPVHNFKRRKPNILLMQNFAYNKMEWPKHYTSEKVLVLMTYTELMNRRQGRETSPQINPLRIYKSRVRNGVSCYEVIWSTPEHYVFPEEQPLEIQGEVRTVEEEAVFRLAYPEVVEDYLSEKALAEENKTKKKKPKSTKGKPAEPCDGVSDLMAQMSLTSSTEDIHPMPALASAPTTGTSTDQPNVVADELPAPPKPHLISRTSHLQSTNCRDEGENVLAPLSPASDGKLTEMETGKSPSVSMVIDALQLSDIDWEALSFTSSPPQQSAGVCPTYREPGASSHHSFKKGKLDTKARSSLDPKLKPESPEPCYSECSLRDRLLMKNTIRSINQGTEMAHNDLPKPVNFHSNLLKPNSSHNQGPKSSLQLLVKVRNDPIPSTKPHVADKTAPVVDKGPTVTGKLNLAYHGSKEPSMPSTQAQSRAKLNGSHGQMPLQKYKFVKVAFPSSSGPPQRSNSEPGQNLNKKLPLTTSKSVCISLCSSSEDSDTENQCQRTRKGDRGKVKTRPKVNHLSDHSLKPTSRLATSTLILGNSICLQTCRRNAMSTDEGHQVEAVISTKPKCMCNPQIIVEDDVFVSSPESPGTLNDYDDSSFSTDSPLPLAERLRLKFK